MPRLRSLSGKEVVDILAQFGFQTVRIRGSHHRLKIQTEYGICAVSVPVHGKKPLKRSTLKSIFRQACEAIPEDELKPHFYRDW